MFAAYVIAARIVLLSAAAIMRQLIGMSQLPRKFFQQYPLITCKKLLFHLPIFFIVGKLFS